MISASHLPVCRSSLAAVRAVVTGALAGALASTGCSTASGSAVGGHADGAQKHAVVAIGVAPSIASVSGLTGEDPVVRGAALAVRDLNAEANTNGGLHFIVRTPAADVRTAVSAAASLRDDPAVVGVIGPTDSQSALDAVPVYGDVEHDGARGLVAISPTATSPVLSGRSPWLFRVCPDDGAASRAAARYAIDSLGARRAAIVYGTNVFGKGWSRAFADAFVQAGGTVVMREPESPRVTSWPTPYAAYAKLGHSDVLVIAGSAADALPFVRATRAAGLVVPVLGGDALSDVRNPSERDEFRDVRYTAFFTAEHPPTAIGLRFVTNYTATYGRPPGHQAALAYDATLLLGHAARSVDGGRRAIRDYLTTIGSSRPAFVGATGVIAFDARHDVVNKPVTLARVTTK